MAIPTKKNVVVVPSFSHRFNPTAHWTTDEGIQNTPAVLSPNPNPQSQDLHNSCHCSVSRAAGAGFAALFSDGCLGVERPVGGTQRRNGREATGGRRRVDRRRRGGGWRGRT